jgi:N-acetylneuraminic acid mutarotase
MLKPLVLTLMKTMKGILTIVAVLMLVTASAHAQTTAFTYQGFLTDGGAPANGVHDFQFYLYREAVAGALVAGPVAVDDLGVTNGLFTALVDFGLVPFEQGDDRWLQIAVRPGASAGSYTNLSPRQAMTPTPYALFAARAQKAATVTGDVAANQIIGTLTSNNFAAGSITTAMLADGAVTSPKLAAGAVGTTQLASNSVTAAQLAPGAAAANLTAGGYAQLPSGAIVLSAEPVSAAFAQAGLVRVPGVVSNADQWVSIPPGPPASGALSTARFDHDAAWNGTNMFVMGGDPVSAGTLFHSPSNTWTVANPANAPEVERCRVFWTGSNFLVWDSYHRVGGRYTPGTGTWQPITEANAPSARYDESAVWTGTNLIVWGGFAVGSNLFLNTGARYNPVTDAWTATATAGAPSARSRHAAVWTGGRMFVQGGVGSDTNAAGGGLYNPVANTWTSIAASLPRYSHSAVWTGTDVIVWGGLFELPGTQYQTNGQRYTVATDSWTTLAFNPIADMRVGHTAIWTGTEMVIWGGFSGTNFSIFDGTYADPRTPLGTGARYHLASNTWSALPASGGSNRGRHTAVWTGTHMLVWGGNGGSGQELDAGLRYSPVSNSWSYLAPAPATGEPSERHSATAIWTGNEALVWGGENGITRLRSGGLYRPGAGWTNLPTAGAPSARKNHTAIWTGAEMIVWGGNANASVNTGARFSVASNQWVPVSTVNAPLPRQRHCAVWTGTEMIVWGGFDTTNFLSPTFLNDGGRYNPLTDTWTNLPPVPPTVGGRAGPTAVWTGTEMIFWGGYTHSGGLTPTFSYFGTGARYHPASNTWSPLPLTGVPTGRTDHTALWTGDRMLVWGGNTSTGETNTGGAYDLALNAWSALPIASAPARRAEHTAVWTGKEMLIVGGLSNSTALFAPAAYLPADDQWVSLLNAPVPNNRTLHAAVWTGLEMLIFNGRAGATEYGAGANDNKSLTPGRSYYLFSKP